MKDVNDGMDASLTNRDLLIIQERVNSCTVPSYLGHIPRKIAPKYCRFKQINGNPGLS